MKFRDWLKDWCEENCGRRDMLGPMAHYMKNKLYGGLPIASINHDDFTILSILFEFKEGTAERWMFAELYMTWETETGKVK